MATKDSSVLSSSWCHAEGLVRVCYSPDGRSLYTAGSEGMVRLWEADGEAVEKTSSEHHMEAVNGLACTRDILATASDDGTIAFFTPSPKIEFTALATRSSANLSQRDVKFDPSGKRVAVASDELMIKVINVEDTIQVKLLTGHSKCPRSISWSPDGKLLTSSSSDGEIFVWDLTSSEPTVVEKIKGLIVAAEPESEYSCEAIWHPDGEFFVVPTKTHEIAIVSRQSWSRIGVFEKDGHNSEVSCLAWSPSGAYLASAGKDSQIIIWDTKTRTPVVRSKMTLAGLVTSLAWRPGKGKNKLSIGSTSGHLTTWDDVVPLGAGAPLPNDRVAPVPTSRAASVGASAGVPEMGREDEDFDEQLPPPLDLRGLEEDDWIIDDDGGDSGYKQKKTALPKFGGRGTSLLGGSDFGSTSQQVFQPGSTPLKQMRRYLAFNMVGVVHTVERDGYHVVTVEFHDRSSNRGYHFDDNFGWSLAALGENGAVFACKGGKDKPSVVYYKPHENWGATSTWQYNLPAGENAVGVAAAGLASDGSSDKIATTTGIVVVATDAGYLRFFTGSGLQRYVWRLGEDVVSMTAGRDWLFVVHRATGAAVDGHQNLTYSIIDIDTIEIVQSGSIPLARRATLKWIGFSDDQIPATYDSQGIFCLLDRCRRPRQARWVPALDTNLMARREGKQESYWPVGASSRQVMCIILKGGEKEPSFPTPLIQELDLQFPLLHLDNAQGVLEESYLRESMIVTHNKDGLPASGNHTLRMAVTKQQVDVDKLLLKMIAMACKTDRIQQALDATYALSQIASVDAAAKVAAFHRLPGLQERIHLIKEGKMNEDEDDVDRRASKWGHLVDERPAVDSSVPRVSNSTSNPLTKPFETVRGKGVSRDNNRYPSEMPIPSTSFSTTSFSTAMDDSGIGSSDVPDDHLRDSPEAETRWDDLQQHNSRDNGTATRLPVLQESKSKSNLNPFAKGRPVSQPEIKGNPFAKKSAGRGLDVKKSGSFFDRVDELENSNPGGKGGRPKTVQPSAKDSSARQTTLPFGGPPPAPKEPANKAKGKKRKSGEMEAESQEERARGKKGSGKRKVAPEGVDTDDSQVTESQGPAAAAATTSDSADQGTGDNLGETSGATRADVEGPTEESPQPITDEEGTQVIDPQTEPEPRVSEKELEDTQMVDSQTEESLAIDPAPVAVSAAA